MRVSAMASAQSSSIEWRRGAENSRIRASFFSFVSKSGRIVPSSGVSTWKSQSMYSPSWRGTSRGTATASGRSTPWPRRVTP